MMTATANYLHTPVLVKETLAALNVQPGGRYVDATVGQGGHALAILEAGTPGAQLLGIDADPDALAVARERLRDFAESFLLVNENFRHVAEVCEEHGFSPVHGILFDLGLSSAQLEAEERGFSFRHEAPLDMRFSPSQQLTAADIVNQYPESELAALLWRLGEEPRHRAIAREVARRRPLASTTELAKIVQKVVPERRRIHPATRTFMALRIAVNAELENLEQALAAAITIMGSGSRLVVIGYHSLEDRLVKNFMRRSSRNCICPPETPVCICGHQATLRLVERKVIKPSPEEMKANPRSRSAKLRVAERL